MDDAAQTNLPPGDEAMTLDAFLAELARVTVPWVEAAFRKEPFPDDAVWIGCSPGKAADWPSAGLVLDNKARKLSSVTRLAATLDDGELARWPLFERRWLGPQAALEALTLVVEDASPDSVWGVIVLLARLAGCTLEPALRVWLPVIEDWETSGTATRPAEEWPALAAALSHARLGGPIADRDKDYQSAWTAMVQFAAESLRRDVTPLSVGDQPHFPLLDSARAALEAECQAYEEWLSHAHVLQLSLPMKDSTTRRMMVDGLVFIEDQVTGAAKTYYRNDVVNSPLKRGFTFAASYRPSGELGSGNDVTIALDERRPVVLTELWQELERRETAAWAGQRPDDHPRIADRLGPWNEPWWLTPNQTLIGSPRMIEVVGGQFVPGSKLSWVEVQDAIWTVCNPLRNVMVVPLGGSAVPILALPAEVCGAKVIRLARWHAAEAGAAAPSARSLSAAPVVNRVLAALTGHQDPHVATGIGALPAKGSWRRVELSGGFAVVSASGVFVLDDWREAAHPDLAALQEVCRRSATLDADLTALQEEDVTPLAARFAALLAQPGRLAENTRLAAEAARIGVRLAQLRSARQWPGNADAAALREALDRAWALDRRLAGMEQQVVSMSGSLKSLGDARLRRVTQIVAVVGFPFYLASGLAKQLALGVLLLGGVGGLWSATVKDGQDPPTWSWWLAFLALFGLGMLAAYLIRQRDSAVPDRS